MQSYGMPGYRLSPFLPSDASLREARFRNWLDLSLCLAESRFAANDNQHVRVFPPGTVVFPKRGASIFLNKVGMLATDAALDPNMMAISPRDNSITSRYLYWFAKGADLWHLAETTVLPQLNHKHLHAARFLVPPVCTQNQICEYLEQLRLATARVGIQRTKARQHTLSLMRSLQP